MFTTPCFTAIDSPVCISFGSGECSGMNFFRCGLITFWIIVRTNSPAFMVFCAWTPNMSHRLKLVSSA
ncbi:hypothetical protein D3C80_1817390 [compost metagenome]